MADQNFDNYQLSQNVPLEKVKPGVLDGRVKVLYDEVTLTSELAANDEISGPELPAGALVLDAWLDVSGAVGGTGTLNLGIRASEDYDGVAIAEDNNFFVSALDATAGAAKGSMSREAGLGVKIGVKSSVFVVNLTNATTSGTGKKVKICIIYAIP